MKRSPMKRSTKPMLRRKPMGKGKKAGLREIAVHAAKAHYFGTNIIGVCQISGWEISQGWCVAHHLTPRAEMREAGVENLDATFRLIILHPHVHIWLHGGQNSMGRPRDLYGLQRFMSVEQSGVNAFNKKMVVLPEPYATDLKLFLERHRC